MVAVLTMLPAQAQIQRKTSSSYDVVATSRVGFIQVVCVKEMYIAMMPTNNRYDKVMMFFLGENRESAEQSISDMIDIMQEVTDEENKTITIENKIGSDLHVSKGMRINIRSKNFAGYVETTKKEWEQLLESLRESK